MKIIQGKYPRKILSFNCAIVKQGREPLGRSMSLAVKHLMIPKDIVKLVAAWFIR